MKDNNAVDPILELKAKARNFISLEATLSIISEKLGCSLSTAAEIILSKIPDEYDWNDNLINPSFFGKKLGIATFSHCNDRPSLRNLLKSVLEEDPYAFEEITTDSNDFDSDIPF